MKRDKSSRPALQPECTNCSRFAIFRTPCDAAFCIFRQKNDRPDWIIL
ncbi:MAG TPA: hypothetical protein PLM07_01715 [Candidatus Rifleibacterium sp.]|nr:hypothetical protein [Candidatus Rifleibacterium sp.]HPT44596.1 hypothetical protein [Candidatus Rifleibacterium sp.]